jgi:hypothetical protein
MWPRLRFYMILTPHICHSNISTLLVSVLNITHHSRGKATWRMLVLYYCRWSLRMSLADHGGNPVCSTHFLPFFYCCAIHVHQFLLLIFWNVHRGGKTPHLNILLQKSITRPGICPPIRKDIGQDRYIVTTQKEKEGNITTWTIFKCRLSSFHSRTRTGTKEKHGITARTSASLPDTPIDQQGRRQHATEPSCNLPCTCLACRWTRSNGENRGHSRRLQEGGDAHGRRRRKAFAWTWPVGPLTSSQGGGSLEKARDHASNEVSDAGRRRRGPQTGADWAKVTP